MTGSNQQQFDDATLDRYEEQLDRRRREGVIARVGDMVWSRNWEVAVLKRRIARDQARLAKLEGGDAQD